MKQIIVAIKDELIGCGSIMAFPNAESAIRSFKEVINGQNEIAKNASDHNLIGLGSYDSETGEILGFEKPRILAKGADLKPVKKDLTEATAEEVKAVMNFNK